jgi:hypothetical protein
LPVLVKYSLLESLPTTCARTDQLATAMKASLT